MDALDAPPRSGPGFDRAIAAVTLIPFAAYLVLHLVGVPALVGAALVFLGGPHVLSTFGLYLEPGVAALARTDLRRYVWLPLAVIPVTAIAFARAPGSLVPWLLTAFFIWQTHHFTKQNVGMFAFWTRARGEAGMTTPERRLILATTAIGVLGVVRAMEVLPSIGPALRGLGLVLLLAMAGAALVIGRGDRRWALLTAVAFYAPLHVFRADLFAAAFAYQAAHGAQYYLMVSQMVRPSPRAVRSTIVLVLVGGVALVAATSTAALIATPLLFGIGKGIVGAHFVADARLWRLRDPDVRALVRQRFSFL